MESGVLGASAGSPSQKPGKEAGIGGRATPDFASPQTAPAVVPVRTNTNRCSGLTLSTQAGQPAASGRHHMLGDRSTELIQADRSDGSHSQFVPGRNQLDIAGEPSGR